MSERGTTLRQLIASLDDSSGSASGERLCVGRMVGVEQGRVVVELAERRVVARVLAQLSPEDVAEGARARLEALVVFPGGRADAVVVGLLRPYAQALLGPPEPASIPPGDARPRRLVVEATDEIELRCGAARIVLRADGRVVVAGQHVETRADGVHRIRGGLVSIN